MTFLRQKPTGFTDDLDTLIAAIANAWDINLSRAIDGLDGGSYTLTAPLTIDGDTVTIDQLIAGTSGQIDGDLDLNGNLLITGDIACDADTTTDLIISRSKRTGTGTETASEIQLTGQTGRDQTGGAANNDGGLLRWKGGLAGTGGSGGIGGAGWVYQETNSAGFTGLPTGVHRGTVEGSAAGAGGFTGRTLGRVMGTNRSGALTVVTICRAAGGTKRARLEYRWIVDTTGGGVLSATADPGNPFNVHNAGFTAVPTLAAGEGVQTGQLALTLTTGSDAEVVHFTHEIKLVVSPSIA